MREINVPLALQAIRSARSSLQSRSPDKRGLVYMNERKDPLDPDTVIVLTDRSGAERSWPAAEDLVATVLQDGSLLIGTDSPLQMVTTMAMYIPPAGEHGARYRIMTFDNHSAERRVWITDGPALAPDHVTAAQLPRYLGCKRIADAHIYRLYVWGPGCGDKAEVISYSLDEPTFGTNEQGKLQ